MNKTDYTASLAMNCIDLIEQTDQEGVPSSTYPHLSLTTFYLIHQMTPLNLFGAVSPPTMGLSPLAASIGHPIVRTIQLFKRLNIASVQQSTTLTTPSLLATWTLKTTHGCQQTTRIMPGKNCGTYLYYMVFNSSSTSPLTSTAAPLIHVLTLSPRTALPSQSLVQPMLVDRTTFRLMFT